MTEDRDVWHRTHPRRIAGHGRVNTIDEAEGAGKSIERSVKRAHNPPLVVEVFDEIEAYTKWVKAGQPPEPKPKPPPPPEPIDVEALRDGLGVIMERLKALFAPVIEAAALFDLARQSPQPPLNRAQRRHGVSAARRAHPGPQRALRAPRHLGPK